MFIYIYTAVSVFVRSINSVLCRQVMKNIDDMPSVITINDTINIRVTGDQDVDVAIVSVTPEKEHLCICFVTLYIYNVCLTVFPKFCCHCFMSVFPIKLPVHCKCSYFLQIAAVFFPFIYFSVCLQGSVVAIPYDEWSLGFIRPSIICIRINGM